MSTMRSKIKAILTTNKSKSEMATEISEVVSAKGSHIESTAVTFVLNTSSKLSSRLFNIVESID